MIRYLINVEEQRARNVARGMLGGPVPSGSGQEPCRVDHTKRWIIQPIRQPIHGHKGINGAQSHGGAGNPRSSRKARLNSLL